MFTDLVAYVHVARLLRLPVYGDGGHAVLAGHSRARESRLGVLPENAALLGRHEVVRQPQLGRVSLEHRVHGDGAVREHLGGREERRRRGGLRVLARVVSEPTCDQVPVVCDVLQLAVERAELGVDLASKRMSSQSVSQSATPHTTSERVSQTNSQSDSQSVSRLVR